MAVPVPRHAWLILSRVSEVTVASLGKGWRHKLEKSNREGMELRMEEIEQIKDVWAAEGWSNVEDTFIRGEREELLLQVYFKVMNNYIVDDNKRIGRMSNA